MQRDFILTFVYQNNENMIYYSSTIKGSLFIFFSLFLSLTLFTMIYKNTLLYSQPRMEQIAQIMVRWISFKVHIDSYTYIYYYYFQQ
jgi:CHASE1-domain containing sensor protein